MATLVSVPSFTRALPRFQARLQGLGGATTSSSVTYCYIRLDGVPGSTTDINEIPAGAYIERKLTS